jgi:hypothetical protein
VFQSHSIRDCAGEREAKHVESMVNFPVSAHQRLEIRCRFPLTKDMAFCYIHHMKRTTIMLTAPQIRQLHALSKRSGIKIAELIRRFIDEGLKRQ